MAAEASALPMSVLHVLSMIDLLIENGGAEGA
jgi:hypothetical protein